jgi:hypothetical protein
MRICTRCTACRGQRRPLRRTHLVLTRQPHGAIARWARVVAQVRGFDDRQLRLETWIVGRPLREDAALRQWFENEPVDSTYRILIHARSYLHARRELHAEFWDTRMYIRPRAHGNAPHVRCLVKQAETLLVRISKAYDVSHDAVVDLLDQAGHVCSYSSGARH